MYLKRKIDEYLINWKKDEAYCSLIVKGARQIMLDYEEDVRKYALGLDQTKIISIYLKCSC